MDLTTNYCSIIVTSSFIIQVVSGIILNLITVIVLSRRTMLSPVNILLCSIAICDGIVMMSYLIFVAHFLIKAASRCESSDYNYHWAVFTLFHAHASVIFHSTSIWLTVSFIFMFFQKKNFFK